MWLHGCRPGEAVAEARAYEREYEEEFSWEALQEDEFGNLKPLVSYNVCVPACARTCGYVVVVVCTGAEGLESGLYCNVKTLPCAAGAGCWG
jgi:hypothetical protein